MRGAVVFPHNIGLGCTRNPKIVEEASRVTAQEVTATGMHWAFGPCVTVPQDERWGRTYEGFGETPGLAAELGAAAVRGLQGDDLSRPGGVLASAKHYVGDGGTTGGVDQGDTRVDEATLRRIHLPGYVAAVKAGVGSVMASFNSWNGEKLHGHKYLLTTVLKGELGFKGFVVSDWKALEQLPGDYSQQIEKSIDAGVDMVMVPDVYPQFFEKLKQLVRHRAPADVPHRRRRATDPDGEGPDGPLRATVRRPDAAGASRIGRAPGRGASGRPRIAGAAGQSKRGAAAVADRARASSSPGRRPTTSASSAAAGRLRGRGPAGPITPGTTILQAIRRAAPRSTISYSPAGEVAKGAAVAVVVIGEAPYAEGKGDRKDLSLDPADVALVGRVKASGVPTVVVLLSGRPMILEPILPHADAIVAAWLPGTEGDGVADVLFGAYNPTGKLSHTWPRSMAQIPINVGPNGEKPKDAPLFEYGFGLRYR